VRAECDRPPVLIGGDVPNRENRHAASMTR
jgi:hypothetical protein